MEPTRYGRGVVGSAPISRVPRVLTMTAITFAVALMPAASADAKGHNCARSGTVTLATTSSARVYRPTGTLSHRLYGCLTSTDVAHRLDRNSTSSHPWTFGTVPRIGPGATAPPGARRWTFAGRFAGVWARASGRSEFWVFDLRTGRMAIRLDGFFLAVPKSGVRYGPLLATNGVPVWLNFYSDASFMQVGWTGRVSACFDSGVQAWNRPCRFDSTDPHTPPVDLSEYGAITALRVSGTAARWKLRGGSRVRNLDYLGA